MNTPARSARGETHRVRVRVEGTVQGVGFRPFVYRLAQEERLTGHVLNDGRGVVIEVEGSPESVRQMVGRITPEAPPLAVIDRLVPQRIEPTGSDTFEIRQSSHGAQVDAVITPDTATCPDCLAELFDPGDRRHRYPFVNCTNCGPRLTIIEGVPYDRELTTMRSFVMCDECEREYRDPANRRFHAQPNACPACGPQASLVDPSGTMMALGDARDPVEAAARLLAGGAVVAVKGLGGYHLAVDATDEPAVSTLRARKHREHKPFALMVADPETADEIILLDDEARRQLTSPARPILLAARRPESEVAPSVAPGSPELGVMLAYTPLHHLLLSDFAALTGRRAILVMTSGNLSDEPIAYEDRDALARLDGVADALLVHDRQIRSRVDDSIVRVVGQRADDGGAHRSARPQVLRRSRGYVPAPLSLPVDARRPLLACGAELKSTFCLARGRRAWISHHVGDLEHYAARVSYVEGIEHFERLLELTPEVVAHDLHPGYASTMYAGERDGVELLEVQHHHAHMAACLAEHGCDPQFAAVGAIYDGTGYGTDGTVWGGEILVGGLTGFRRVAALRPVRLPGGEAAIRAPWRMACAWLNETFGGDADRPPTLTGVVDERRWKAVASVAGNPELSPVTTSMGRLFDAVAAICGIAPEVTYEGQAAIELTAAIADRAGTHYEMPVEAGPGSPQRWTLDPRPALEAIVHDVGSGRSVGEIALGFHTAVAVATARVCSLAATESGLDTVVLSGGVFQNRHLLEASEGLLEAEGLRVLTPVSVPCNDGGIAYGQAAVAAAASGT